MLNLCTFRLPMMTNIASFLQKFLLKNSITNLDFGLLGHLKRENLLLG